MTIMVTRVFPVPVSIRTWRSVSSELRRRLHEDGLTMVLRCTACSTTSAWYRRGRSSTGSPLIDTGAVSRGGRKRKAREYSSEVEGPVHPSSSSLSVAALSRLNRSFVPRQTAFLQRGAVRKECRVGTNRNQGSRCSGGLWHGGDGGEQRRVHERPVVGQRQERMAHELGRPWPQLGIAERRGQRRRENAVKQLTC